MKPIENRILRAAIRPLYRWHRRAGIIAALFVAMLSITGIALNHNVDWGLNQKIVDNEIILSIYGVAPEAQSDFGYPTDIVTIDRVLLDIHTGRFMGAIGPYVMDGIALLFLVLVFSGFYMWLYRVKRGIK